MDGCHIKAVIQVLNYPSLGVVHDDHYILATYHCSCQKNTNAKE